MGRRKMEGLWLPRTDIDGWRVSGGGVTYDQDEPGPVVGIDIELDSIGCLASGSLELAGGQPWTAFGVELLIEIRSKSRGWVPVARGCVPPAEPRARLEWSVKLEPLENRDLDGYFDGSLTNYNMLGDFEVTWTTTNREVVEHLLKRWPTGSIGVDWAGRVILAAPEHGSPARLTESDFFSWEEEALEVLPYATEARWDGGKGWAKGEYKGIPREGCVPRRSVDAGAVTFEDRVGPTGPPLVAFKEVALEPAQIGSLQFDVASKLDGEYSEVVPSPPREPIYHEGLLLPPTGQPIRREVQAKQYAVVAVYDLQHWYEQSALAEGAESTYEPLSGKLSFGFIKRPGGSDVVSGVSVWLSTVPWDDKAVGRPLPPEQPNPDPDKSLDAETDVRVNGVEGATIIHPFASPQTIRVSESDLRELTDSSAGLPWQSSPLTIPEQYFRTPLANNLGQLLDARWREKQEQIELEAEAAGQLPAVVAYVGQPFSYTFSEPPTGSPPPGLTLTGTQLNGTPTQAGTYTLAVGEAKWTLHVRGDPPSQTWSQRWYLHVAAWWAATTTIPSVAVVSFPPDRLAVEAGDMGAYWVPIGGQMHLLSNLSSAYLHTANEGEGRRLLHSVVASAQKGRGWLAALPSVLTPAVTAEGVLVGATRNVWYFDGDEAAAVYITHTRADELDWQEPILSEYPRGSPTLAYKVLPPEGRPNKHSGHYVLYALSRRGDEIVLIAMYHTDLMHKGAEASEGGKYGNWLTLYAVYYDIKTHASRAETIFEKWDDDFDSPHFYEETNARLVFPAGAVFWWGEWGDSDEPTNYLAVAPHGGKPVVLQLQSDPAGQPRVIDIRRHGERISVLYITVQSDWVEAQVGPPYAQLCVIDSAGNSRCTVLPSVPLGGTRSASYCRLPRGELVVVVGRGGYGGYMTGAPRTPPATLVLRLNENWDIVAVGEIADFYAGRVSLNLHMGSLLMTDDVVTYALPLPDKGTLEDPQPLKITLVHKTKADAGISYRLAANLGDRVGFVDWIWEDYRGDWRAD